MKSAFLIPLFATLLILSGCIPGTLCTQPRSDGRILDARTLQPISAASVTLTGGTGGPHKQETRSDGKFQFLGKCDFVWYVIFGVPVDGLFHAPGVLSVVAPEYEPKTLPPFSGSREAIDVLLEPISTATGAPELVR